MAALYRVEAAEPKSHASTSRRPPSNVPYVVDNLWEWARPAPLPSRRGCAYASPTPELARQNASGSKANTLVKLQFEPDAVVLQKEVADARKHPDCVASKQPGGPTPLHKQLLALLDKHCTHPAYSNWASQPVHLKIAAAPLYLPAADQDELNAVLGPGRPLVIIAEELRKAITFWDSLPRVDLVADELPYSNNELFFADKQAVSGRTVIG